MSINTTDSLIRKCSEIAWYAKSNHELADGIYKRKNANELGYRAVKHILELLRIGYSDLAIEIGMTAIQMFSDGNNYHQVLSCIEGLRDYFRQSRLEDDALDYENSAKISLEELDSKTLDGRIDILYNLVWENGCLGTSDAMKFFKKKLVYKLVSQLFSRILRILNLSKEFFLMEGLLVDLLKCSQTIQFL